MKKNYISYYIYFTLGHASNSMSIWYFRILQPSSVIKINWESDDNPILYKKMTITVIKNKIWIKVITFPIRDAKDAKNAEIKLFHMNIRFK